MLTLYSPVGVNNDSADDNLAKDELQMRIGGSIPYCWDCVPEMSSGIAQVERRCSGEEQGNGTARRVGRAARGGDLARLARGGVCEVGALIRERLDAGIAGG